MSEVKKVLRSAQFYEWVFAGSILLSFLLWAGGIFCTGEESSQFGLFFLNCRDFFADTTNVVGYSSQRDVYHNTMYTGLQEKAYPPLTYMMMYFFSKLVDMEPYYEADDFLQMYTEPKFLIMYLIYAAVGVVMVYELTRTCKNGSNKVKIFTAAAVCVSAPMLFSYERANTIILTLFCIMFYLFYYDSENKWMKEFALICLAVATAFKMTPALLGILLLYNRQWKEALRTVLYGIIIGIGPFFFFEGGLSNLSQMFHNMKLNVTDYNSTTGATLTAALVSFGAEPTAAFQNVMKWITYLLCLILLAAAPLYRSQWEKLMAVSMVLIVAPTHSGRYCVLYIIPAAIAFLNAQEHKETDLIILVSLFLICQDIQSRLGTTYLNYHLALILLMAVLTVRGIYVLQNSFFKFIKKQLPTA